jgi:hypothetical protein
MRQNWTDDRMDDLAQHVDAGFVQVRVDMGSDLRVKMDARFDALHATLAANQRTMLQMCGGLCVALIAAVATLISTIV